MKYGKTGDKPLVRDTSRSVKGKRLHDRNADVQRLPIPAASLLICLGGTAAWANENANEISECDVFIEINATDEDAGWQGILDGSPWTLTRIIGPDDEDHETYNDRRHTSKAEDGETFIKVRAQDAGADQGLTEYRWESAEPTFDVFALEDFLDRFPEGIYKCKVRFVDGKPERVVEEDELTHCLPDGPVISDPGGPLPAGIDWIVMWEAVTTQYDQNGPGLGAPLDECEPEDELVKYSVTVELENADGDEKVSSFDVLDPEATAAVVSGGFLECGLTGKVEIGAFVDSGNSTFREVEIATSDCP